MKTLIRKWLGLPKLQESVDSLHGRIASAATVAEVYKSRCLVLEELDKRLTPPPPLDERKRKCEAQFSLLEIQIEGLLNLANEVRTSIVKARWPDGIVRLTDEQFAAIKENGDKVYGALSLRIGKVEEQFSNALKAYAEGWRDVSEDLSRYDHLDDFAKEASTFNARLLALENAPKTAPTVMVSDLPVIRPKRIRKSTAPTSARYKKQSRYRS